MEAWQSRTGVRLKCDRLQPAVRPFPAWASDLRSRSNPQRRVPSSVIIAARCIKRFSKNIVRPTWGNELKHRDREKSLSSTDAPFSNVIVGGVSPKRLTAFKWDTDSNHDHQTEHLTNLRSRSDRGDPEQFQLLDPTTPSSIPSK